MPKPDQSGPKWCKKYTNAAHAVGLLRLSTTHYLLQSLCVALDLATDCDVPHVLHLGVLASLGGSVDSSTK